MTALAVFGVWIPADEATPIELVCIDGDDYNQIRKYVGGDFAGQDVFRPPSSLFFHDEGKILDLPLNRRATLFWWVHRTEFRNHDALLGDVLILGPADDEGNCMSIEDSLIDLLFHTDSYRYLVKTINEKGWHGNQRTFDNWVDCYNNALALAERWSLVEHVKVVAA